MLPWFLVSGQSVHRLMTVSTTVTAGHGVSFALGATKPFTTETSTRCPHCYEQTRTVGTLLPGTRCFPDGVNRVLEEL